jgi:molybdopterin converting factor subunit 1
LKVRLRFFAAIREIVGCDEMERDVSEGVSTGGLLNELVSEYPKLEPFVKVAQIAVNHDVVDLRHALEPDDEVAFLPPVSGG